MDFAYDEVEDRSGSENGGNGRHSGPDKQGLFMTATCTRMETIKFVHKWTIDQFSVQQELCQIGDSLESTPFGSINCEPYRFKLKLFPCGKDEECRGYLSLFLQIHKCPTSKLRFRVNFYIETTEGPRGCALNRNIVTINKGGIVTASKFFSTESLKSRNQRFLPDDTLTVGVELTVFGEQSNREIPQEDMEDARGSSMSDAGAAALSSSLTDAMPTSSSGAAGSTLGSDLAALLDNKEHTDCKLHVGRRTFPAHKAILCARSPVFAAMFGHHDTSEAINSEATLEDVTPDAVAAMLEFIYTDKCIPIETRTAEILAAADKYCLLRLKSMCENLLCRSMSPLNLCDRLRLADTYSAARLRRKVLLTFQRHRNEVLASQEWAELEVECPLLAAKVLKELMKLPDDAARYTMMMLPSSSHSQNEPVSKRSRLS